MATANPSKVTVTKDGWVAVATNVTNITVHILNNTPKYAWTYRLTAAAAPTDLSEAVPLKPSHNFCAPDAFDLYLYCHDDDGQIRLDVDFTAEFIINA